jgi:hypothetical protein
VDVSVRDTQPPAPSYRPRRADFWILRNRDDASRRRSARFFGAAGRTSAALPLLDGLFDVSYVISVVVNVATATPFRRIDPDGNDLDGEQSLAVMVVVEVI